jgi:hypothetical protein
MMLRISARSTFKREPRKNIRKARKRKSQDRNCFKNTSSAWIIVRNLKNGTEK